MPKLTVSGSQTLFVRGDGSFEPPSAAATGGAPAGPAGGDLAGSYPNPSIASPVTGKQYAASSESVTVNNTASGAVTLDVSAANVFQMTLTGNVTFTFAGAATSGVSYSFTLYLVQDATGGRTVTWPGSVSWAGGVTPSIPTGANSVSVLVFETVNAGTTWYGSVVANPPALPLSVANGGTGQATASAALSALGGAPLAGATFTGAVVPAVTALSDGATISLNAALGNVFTVTLGGNRTLANPANPVAGQTIHVHVTQDATGSRTLSYGTAYDFGTAGAPVLTTTANKMDILGFTYDANLAKWCFLGSGLGFL